MHPIKLEVRPDAFVLSGKPIPFSEVCCVAPRGSDEVEIFASRGRSYLLALSPAVCSVVLGAGLPPPESPEAVLRAYATSPLSNFEFLIRLNLACGRTFNSLSSYRVFPSFLNRFDDRSTCRDITNTPAQSRPDPDRVGGHLLARCSSLLFSSLLFSSFLWDGLVGLSAVWPEYFFFSEVSRAPYELPKWAPTPFEFVHKHRKLLEQPAISAMVPAWAEGVFGLTERPAKFVRRSAAVADADAVLPLGGRLLRFAAVTKDASPDELSLCLVLGSALQQFHTVAFPLRNELAGEQCLELSPRMRFVAVAGQIAIYNPTNSELTRLDECDIETEEARFEINLIVGVGDKVLAAATPSSLWLDGKVSWHSEARISGVAGSEVFHILVFAVYDGWIRVIALRHWRPVRKVAIDGEVATRIAVTEAFGIIVVLTTQHVWCFTVTGVLVRKADAHNKVGWFEALYPERRTIVCQFPEIVALHYKKSAQCIVAVSREGKLKTCHQSSDINPIAPSKRRVKA
jgi:hypothetical protein